MSIIVIDYGSGNLRSAEKALQLACDQAQCNAQVVVTNDAEKIAKATHIVLPGVGAFKDCLTGLKAQDGVLEALTTRVMHEGYPFLGICVGMQLMADRGNEHEVTSGFGWIQGEVKKMSVEANAPLPHMGWNTLDLVQNHPLLDGIQLGEAGLHAYFVHTFAFECEQKEECITTTSYGNKFASCIGRDNLFGTQFHPEKSQILGIQLLKNFIRWAP